MRSFILLLALLVAGTFRAGAFNFNKGAAATDNYYVKIPYQFDKGIPIIEIVVNGKKRRLMFDTGAMTAVSAEIAKELKLRVKGSVDVGDSGGLEAQMSVVVLPGIDLGGVVFEDVPAVVLRPSFFTECLGIDGVIGSNLLRNSIVQFVGPSHTIILTDQLEKLDVNGLTGIPVALSATQSNPHIQVHFGADTSVAKELLLFDSGSNGFYDLSTNSYLKQFKPKHIFTERYAASGSGSLGIHGAEAPKPKYKVRIPEFIVAGYTFRDLSVNTNATGSSRIGAALLKHGTVTVDYRHKKFYFNPDKNADTASMYLLQKNWPVDFVPADGHLVVGTVWEPALQGEIMPGDELLRFGPLDFEKVVLCNMLGGLKYEGDTATVILRDHQTKALKEVELTRN